MKNKPYLIGETAFHHQGDTSFLYNLIDEGSAIVDAIKFHLLLNLNDYFTSDHKAFSSLKDWMICEKDWVGLIDYTISKSIDVILLCNDRQSIDFAIDYSKRKPIKAIEIHATGINDILLLEKALGFNGNIMIGTGGSSIDEISFAVNFLKQNSNIQIILMHGFQNYPTSIEDINFSRLLKLKSLFDLPMGYADHTDPSDENNIIISASPVLFGVNIIEKHFTNKISDNRIDSQSAVSLSQLKKIKELMNVFNLCMGNFSLQMSDSELEYGDTGVMKKAIVANKDIFKGEFITKDKIAYKRTNSSTYMSQINIMKLIGLKAKKDISADSFIDFSNVEYEFKKTEFKQFKIKK